MISPLDQDGVLASLGDKCLSAIAAAVGAARQDLADMREWRPGWFPPMSERGLSNIIHERIWAHLCARLDGEADLVIVDSEPHRMLHVGTTFRLRVKRHHPDDRISTYATAAALEFWTQGNQTLEGLEIITLGAGYRWEKELRKIGPPVVSCRDGKDNPLWSVELVEPAAGVVGITWTPVDGPRLPDVDLSSAVDRAEEGPEGGVGR
jgi:hypothetical protein